MWDWTCLALVQHLIFCAVNLFSFFKLELHRFSLSLAKRISLRTGHDGCSFQHHYESDKD
jgi:hypothetical protein